MPEYWLVSIPGDRNPTVTFQNFKAKIASSQNDLSEVTRLPIPPEFKIGTLDTLMVLSEDLAKQDTAFESSANKLIDIIRTLLGPEAPAKLPGCLSVNEKTIDNYLKTFQWNTMKYRTDKSLVELAGILNNEVASIDTLMKNKMANYSVVKGNLQGIQRREVGNLASRNIVPFVKKEHVVLDSEYLETLIVAVPKTLYKDWRNKYETLTQMVVPRSSQKIAEDDEYGLFTVTLFRRIVDDFTNKCREERFIVRDFKYSEDALEEQKRELQEMDASEKELWGTILRLSKTNFGEVFQAWTHLKCLRVFVESVLRYGLPPDFVGFTIKPKPKQEDKILNILTTQYGYLGGSSNRGGHGGSSHDDTVEEAIPGFNDKDYKPFVFFSLRLDIERQ
ncbi:Vacuolar ATP synthase subunit C [Entomortierella chlamydospora]|uniref:V-type proton ATPase subunit C n=1 Tax=Entomortierella chlamydospora TaxID=101097 RepID=A0A9P6N2K0_9FUNG|nr:Vacuolar ATP synthase subunit C [Entomortierella chlamydospora]KAG0021351.1 Vacuolar ATP synthase subunit C [Entomortierella chlamydospora]